MGFFKYLMDGLASIGYGFASMGGGLNSIVESFADNPIEYRSFPANDYTLEDDAMLIVSRRMDEAEAELRRVFDAAGALNDETSH